jgi:hypothetical protein
MKRIAFAVIVVAAIAACQSDRPFPPGPNAEIQDANHGEGNDFFFWLSPVINQHAPASQTFSGKLSPVVTITNSCGGGVVRTFSGADISASNAAYHVNWQTAQDNLDPACTYRVTVRVGSSVMGFADVNVVSNGRELKNVNTNEVITLLDDRTLPLQFFLGVGSQCREGADCGEGTARGGTNTVIVTTSGRAGVFIPANALPDGQEVTISVESVDERIRGECIPGLADQYPGTPGVEDNACYDYHADTGEIEQSTRFQFNNPVTVGICPDVEALGLDHETMDAIQIFQFDEGEEVPIQPLDNTPAPFLRCDPHFTPSFGARRSFFKGLADAVAALLGPRPLYARTRSAMFDLGAGGSTDGFSRFTWALPHVID